MTDTPLDPHDEHAMRALKRQQWCEATQSYPNTFKPSITTEQLHQSYAEHSREALTEVSERFELCGRMMTRRIMGKASFFNLKDDTGTLQVYLAVKGLPDGQYDAYQAWWDLGDLVYVAGTLFRTKTGELTLHADEAHLLSKSLRPLPDKFHGLHDQEIRYRQRYLDLIVNESTRSMVKQRALMTRAVTRFLDEAGYLQVETPMMHALPGGAAAKPFISHHNALDMPLYLRIAPELYLKRLMVGDLGKVYELNRNFRNEGISTRHNPEFTMVEFYAAYHDYEDQMDLTEALLRHVAHATRGSSQLPYQGHTIDMEAPFKRISMIDAICEARPDLRQADLHDLDRLRHIAAASGLQANIEDVGKGQLELFEAFVEKDLIQPTFITAYPTSVSPLARRNDSNPDITDRFELFVGGQEIANGFSELNDPLDQAERFHAQAAERRAGDDEAMHFDQDYITAMEYGMPPTAGVGIGMDRLAMLLTNAASIRDVLLFPLLKPKA